MVPRLDVTANSGPDFGYLGLVFGYFGLNFGYLGFDFGYLGLDFGYLGLDFGYFGLDFGYFVLDFGYLGLNSGFDLGYLGLDFGYFGLDFGYFGLDLGYFGLDFRYLGLDFEYLGLDFGHLGLDFGYLGLDFGYLGLDFGYLGLDFGYLGLDFGYLESFFRKGTPNNLTCARLQAELTAQATSSPTTQSATTNREVSTSIHCNATWDSLYCWPSTPAGQRVQEKCSTVFSDIPSLVDHPKAIAFRDCDLSGRWVQGAWTNYTQCLQVIDQQDKQPSAVEAVRYIIFIGSLLSLLALAITIFIFTYFRSLECDRLRVHRNLVTALIVRFVLMLILAEPFISRRQNYTYRDLDWLCKSVLALKMYATMASINWMFVEGFFLHSRLTSNVFDSGAPFCLYYFIGWGLPLAFIVAWAVLMSCQHRVHCWKGYGDLQYRWILVAPMITALLINLLFLINIIRILVTKLRASDAVETTQVRKAIKATAILFPLLGIPNLLFAVRPGDKGDLESVYMVTNSLLQSSQGIFVSVLYCFLNGEVQELLKKRYRQYRVQKEGGYPPQRRKSTKSTIILPSSFVIRSNALTTTMKTSPATALATSGGGVKTTTTTASAAETSSKFAKSSPLVQTSVV
ncbi:corticotropin-releasing factor receptor 2-like [Oratosquilla oratoria]|uniref:corticotropin-releasing factor receptor 2-like n=1 Tax=Oratosquilla oratoria TaxID=337810 RepID=UPI003F76AE44